MKLRLPHSWRPELIGLIVAAVITRFWCLYTPNAIVFDETYFKVFAAHYLDHNYYFDIHPPFGKLLLAGLAWLQHLSPADMLTGTAVSLRLLPAAAGALLVPLVWAILRRLGVSRPLAFLGASLILLDNALLTESRFILMDSTLLLCGLGALYLYLRARDAASPSRRWIWIALAALSAGAAASIKWTGLTALAVTGLLWLWDQRGTRASWLRRTGELAIFALVPTLLYLSVFWLHFKLLPHSGDGDAFMSPKFQATLVGNTQYDPQTRLTFPSKFIELNQEMYRANQTLTATHPYGSRWYTWPLGQRPVYYWQGDPTPSGRQGNIYLLGNPFIWWGIWLAIIAGAVYAWIKVHKFKPATTAGLAITGAAFLINLLPFVAVSRVMFLYHYFFSFIFSLMFAIILWNDIARTSRRSTRHRILAIMLGIVIIGFIIFAPLTYGAPLSPEELQARMWLPSWR